MNPEDIAILIAGIIAPFISNWIKGDNTGKAALWLAFFISCAVALVALIISGSFQLVYTDPLAFTESFVKACAVVFSLATLIYKQFLSKKEAPHA